MESFPLFFRIRAIAFTIIMLSSFLWLVLLSVEIFARWTKSDQISHSLMVVFILTNAITLILLPILLLVRFRAWLDAARLFLLLLLQTGSAAAGSYWSPKIQCPDQTLDDIGVCQLISVYTEIACWIIPAILVFYCTYFAIVVYLQSRIPVVVEIERHSGEDPEMGPADSALWREMLKEIVGTQRSSSDTSVQPLRPLVLPTMAHTSQSSITQSPTTPLSASPNVSHNQSTVPLLPHASQEQLPRPGPSRHHSLPAFGHGDEPHIRPVLTLPIPSLPQTPSPSTSSLGLANPLISSFDFGPGTTDAGSPVDHRWCSKHLSMMHSSEMQRAESPRSKRARLSKPLPAHFM